MVDRKTSLWRRSLARRTHDLRKEAQERLAVSYESVRRTIIPLLREVTHTAPDFTQHDETHSDALWETAGHVYDDLDGINPAEAWLLGCAFLIHDAAMGRIPPDEDIAEYMGRPVWRDLMAATFLEMRGRWPNDAEISDPPEDVYNACLTRAIRNTHASRGADLVTKAWRMSGGDGFLIEDTELRHSYGPLIGKLAASHWRDVGDLPDLFSHTLGAVPFLPEEWTVDPLKLACILRLADATQLDSRRAPSFLFALRNPQGVSREHWVFQEHMVRPRREGDRIVYSSSRPFEKQHASSWWRALAYLQEVDRELKRVDSLLYDLGRPRMAARAVAGVDRPERFAKYFEVKGWQPIDASVRISDVSGHIAVLGGEQLYGRDRREVALRELIQNAQDAVLARRVMEPLFDQGKVIVRLVQEGQEWLLEVHDSGVGMDEAILKDGLLDFGRSGWRTDVVQAAFPGLMSDGFRPAGNLGVGFYSVLMLGDQVTVTTRRFDRGSGDARQLTFSDGLRTRPMVCRLPSSPLVPAGTVVRVVLRHVPLESDGLLATTSSDRLIELVRRLVPSHCVPIIVEEQHAGGEHRDELARFDLASASADEVFDQLYPRRDGFVDNEAHRTAARAEFSAQATAIPGHESRGLGLAVLGRHLTVRYQEAQGIVVLDGFRADRHSEFTGYIEGMRRRASRDNVELACTPEQLRTWITSQVQCLRDRRLFDLPAQLELAALILRAMGDLEDDHCVALTEDGLLSVGDIPGWAGDRDQILLSYAGPCEWETRPAVLRYRPNGRDVHPPKGWLVLGPSRPFPLFDAMLPPHRDRDFADHGHDSEPTWQKRWWRSSGDIEGLVLRRICQAWDCTPGDLLGPVAERGWKDSGVMIPGVRETPVLRFERPRP